MNSVRRLATKRCCLPPLPIRAGILVAWRALVLLVAALAARTALAQEKDPPAWPQWRGPQSRATVLAADADASARTRTLWQVPLGLGWSSPVVVDNRVFISDRADGAEHVLAFAADTGRELWRHANPVDFDPHPVGQRHGNGPKATPLVHGGRVYSVGIAGELSCLNAADGSVVWRLNYPAEFGARQPLPGGRARVNGTENVLVPVGPGIGAPVPLFGYTGSPTLIDDKLIVPVGGQKAGTIVALNKDTGRVVWKALKEHVSYSSPVVAEVAGVMQVVVMTGPRVVGLGVADGALLWSHPFQIQYDESISTPAVANDMVLITATGRPLTALRIESRDKGQSAKVAWSNNILSSYLSSMVIADGHVYGMNDGGEFSCLRLADGQIRWTGGNHGYYSSPIVAGSKLVALNEQGNLLLLARDPTAYRELETVQLFKGESWTMPAMVGNRLYVRNGAGLACFEMQPAAQ